MTRTVSKLLGTEYHELRTELKYVKPQGDSIMCFCVLLSLCFCLTFIGVNEHGNIGICILEQLFLSVLNSGTRVVHTNDQCVGISTSTIGK